MHFTRWEAILALENAGNKTEHKIRTMVTTTKSSIKVKPRRKRFTTPLCHILQKNCNNQKSPQRPRQNQRICGKLATMELQIGQTIYKLQRPEFKLKQNQVQFAGIENFIGVEKCTVESKISNWDNAWNIVGESGKVYQTYGDQTPYGFYTDYDSALEFGVKNSSELLKRHQEELQAIEKMHINFMTLYEQRQGNLTQ
jgi:hypothetical protein